MKLKASKTFFTSDTHFYHKNIIKYCNRPYKDVEEMNHDLIQRWNSVVPEDGTTIHCGDGLLGGIGKWSSIFPALNGEIIWVKGNHDPAVGVLEKLGFKSVHEQLMFTVEGDEEIPEQRIYASHYPHITWPEVHKGSWHIFGHIHSVNGQSAWKDIIQPGSYDVGVDNNNYAPISFQKLKEIITKQLLYAKRNL